MILLKTYLELLQRRPVLVNSSTGFVLAAAGDVAAQFFEQKQAQQQQQWQEFHVSGRRALDMGLIRALVVAPFVSYWYPFLGRRFSNTLVKVAVDQAVGSPIVISIVFVLSAVLRGEGFSAGVTLLQKQGHSTWCLGVQYWTPVHLITFGVIPIQHQPIFGSIASIPWNVILSFGANNKERATPFPTTANPQ